MKQLRRTNRATVHWITRLFLGYAKDYHIAHRAFQGTPLTAAEHSRWSVQMAIRQLRATARQSDEGEDTNDELCSHGEHVGIVSAFESSLRQQGYDEFDIADMMASHIHLKTTTHDIVRSPVAQYILAPLASIVNDRHSDYSIKDTVYYGPMIALMDVPQYRAVFQRLMHTLWGFTGTDEWDAGTDKTYLYVSIDRMHAYAKILLLAMIQETNTRITYQDNVPYEWQHPLFVETLHTVITEHHDTLQQVLYTVGMSVRVGSRTAYRRFLNDGLRTVTMTDQHLDAV